MTTMTDPIFEADVATPPAAVRAAARLRGALARARIRAARGIEDGKDRIAALIGIPPL